MMLAPALSGTGIRKAGLWRGTDRRQPFPGSAGHQFVFASSEIDGPNISPHAQAVQRGNKEQSNQVNWSHDQPNGIGLLRLEMLLSMRCVGFLIRASLSSSPCALRH